MTDTAGGRLPDFLMIGATKAGTTSLHAYLRAHPDVFLHPRKEMRFFTTEHHWERGADWYAAQFAEGGDAPAVGEASNAYTRHPAYPGVPARAASVLPDARFVYLTREPFARLESHYRWRLSTGYEWRPPAEAFRADPSYIAASLYGLQLAEWRRHYGAERLLVVQCERLFAAPRPHLEEICGFLGVGFDPRLPFRRENSTQDRRAVAAPLRRLARGPLRKPVRRFGRAIARGPLGRGSEASAAAYHLPDELRSEIAALFEDDRRLLTDLAGAEAARWPDISGKTNPSARLRRVPGFAERPAGWLGAELGLAPSPSEESAP